MEKFDAEHVRQVSKESKGVTEREVVDIVLEGGEIEKIIGKFENYGPKRKPRAA